jgi:hypothetical protein
MAGFDVYIYGADTAGVYPANSSEWFKVSILGLNYDEPTIGESKRGQLGGYRHPLTHEKTFALNCKPVPALDWFLFISTLRSHLTKKYIYFRRGTYPAGIAPYLSENTRFIPTGRSKEDNYENGTKKISVECVVYE